MASILGPASILVMGISIFFLAAVVPDALDSLFAANTTSWDASTVALWGLLPLAIIAALVLVFIPRNGGD